MLNVHYAGSVMLSVVMLSVIMISTVMLSVVMLRVSLLSVVLISVVMLNVVMLSAVAPLEKLAWDKHSSLIQTFLNYSCKEFYNFGPSALLYLHYFDKCTLNVASYIKLFPTAFSAYSISVIFQYHLSYENNIFSM
jgi:hypothetical protein